MLHRRKCSLDPASTGEGRRGLGTECSRSLGPAHSQSALAAIVQRCKTHGIPECSSSKEQRNARLHLLQPAGSTRKLFWQRCSASPPPSLPKKHLRQIRQIFWDPPDPRELPFTEWSLTFRRRPSLTCGATFGGRFKRPKQEVL